MNDDGTMMRAHAARRFAARHGLPLLSIDDLVRHRMTTDTLVRLVATTRMPTRVGDFTRTSSNPRSTMPSTWR